ncbi:Hypothetical predicted protein [Mytilus galloprovincialis]|uniref:Activation-induced cytidine deaminase AID domain-containing protein n=1 Tax=Mytilus galloprovincialis TaxID=29158 RepID=A0A8B6G1P9_MYTGA|nr:Hypothetical predicted protein [Mytilus galloprovincialis]
MVPPPVIFPTGANNQTFVSKADFQEKFAIPYRYGDKSKPWPHTTILLYKYSSNAITKYPVIPENTWQRIDNDPRNAYYEGGHAESILIKKMTKTQEHLKKQPYNDRESYNGIHTIEVILNYSPCHCCSTKLCDFKKILERDVSALELTVCSNDSKDGDDAFATMFQSLRTKGNVDIKITFANFYKYYSKENMEGLKELLRNDIELDLLTGDTWLNFFDAVGFDRTTELPIGRKDREKADEKMLENIMLEINEL